jgi:hypothetical protein
MPRCRSCPVTLAAELRAVLPGPEPEPPHLAGLPQCLHKYEPLFRREDAGGERAVRPG